MIPAVREFVVSIDLPTKQIIVNPVEGLVQE
jgi:ribosomal 30S subunit maturation factor RimM